MTGVGDRLPPWLVQGGLKAEQIRSVIRPRLPTLRDWDESFDICEYVIPYALTEEFLPVLHLLS